MVQPQGCLEVASIYACAPGFCLLFLVPLVGRTSAWQVTQSLLGPASQVGARAFYVILVMSVT